jgi:hypothetical protein
MPKTVRTALLFDRSDLPRSPQVKRMRVRDAGQSGGHKVIQFVCPHCNYDTGWIINERTITENKRGIPCPRCNEQSNQATEATTMSRNYNCPTVDVRWADSRETHMAVATAIHAISGPTRTPEAIWESPTPAEIDHVAMAVEEYLRHGDFPRSADGCYHWGEEVVRVEE